MAAYLHLYWQNVYLLEQQKIVNVKQKKFFRRIDREMARFIWRIERLVQQAGGTELWHYELAWWRRRSVARLHLNKEDKDRSLLG